MLLLIFNYWYLNPIQDGAFRGCSRMGGAKKLLLPKMSHIFCNDETWHSYTLRKENQKNLLIT